MRILFVAMSESVHSARWIHQLADRGWELHLFPSGAPILHSGFANVIFHPPYRKWNYSKPPGNKIVGRSMMVGRLWRTGSKWFPGLFKEAKRLASLIDRLQPDVVHSIEIQHAGYLTLEAARLTKRPFPTWLTTNWGSDTYLFGRLAEHREKIRQVFQACDYYSCECQRDIRAARELDFSGSVWPVLPNGGGFHLAQATAWRAPGPAASRRVIALKGYQNWAGRSLVGLRAIVMCADVLQGYRIAIYNANPDVELAAQLASRQTGIPIDIVPPVAHEEMLRLHGRARVSIGLSISDGVSTSFLEALAMGSFPIQSSTAAADEWITHGESGFIVHPEDPHEVAAALRQAVTNDTLVNHASQTNADTARQRLNYEDIRRQVIQLYQALDRTKSSAQSPSQAA
ncbi:MAG: glycosyltransferase [Pirellulaceae bacterium]